MEADRCDGCGREYPSGLLNLDEESGDFLCEECLVEKESCACSDDD